MLLRRVSHEGFLEPAIADIEDRTVGVTIGNFDGLHLGHQQLFSVLKERVRSRVRAEEGKRSPCLAVLTFHPHPRAFLARSRGETEKVPLPVSTLRSKAELAEKFGFDLCVSAHFTKHFAMLSAEEFVERFLIRGLGASIVVVGHDWAFGKGREGSVEVLERLGAKFGFEVGIVPPVEIDGMRVSTTLLREALQAGDIATVTTLLGRTYSVSGRVCHGAERGASLGFRTANLELGRIFLPKNGVYAVRVMMANEGYDAIANLGVRPTFGGGPRLLEVHVLDRDLGSIYGQRMEVMFAGRIRDERNFSEIEGLKRQITHDIEEARRILAATL